MSRRYTWQPAQPEMTRFLGHSLHLPFTYGTQDSRENPVLVHCRQTRTLAENSEKKQAWSREVESLFYKAQPIKMEDKSREGMELEIVS